MIEAIHMQSLTAAISPMPTSPLATRTEREARSLLCLNTFADTARAKMELHGAGNGQMSAEWYFLMGVCALRQGYMTDAQAHLDHACTLCKADGREVESEYRAMYESVRHAVEKRRRSHDETDKKDHKWYSDLSFCDCCDCCCVHHDGSICDCCDGDCDCCNCCD